MNWTHQQGRWQGTPLLCLPPMMLCRVRLNGVLLAALTPPPLPPDMDCIRMQNMTFMHRASQKFMEMRTKSGTLYR